MLNYINNFSNFVLKNKTMNFVILGLLAIYFGSSAGAIISILRWDIGFVDSASPFMESLVDLYFVVWYMLVVILVGVVYILARIIAAFTWNTTLNSILGKLSSLVINFFIYFGFLFIEFVNKFLFISFFRNTALRRARANILNVWHGKKKAGFLHVQNIAEYRRLEFLWCVAPSTALVSIGNPTFGLIFALDPAIDPDIVVKIIAHQWYWSYEYDVSFKVTPDAPDYAHTDRARFTEAYMSQFVFPKTLQEMLEADFGPVKPRYITEEDMRIYFKEVVKHKDIVHYTMSFDSTMQDVDDLNPGTKRLLETTNPVVLPVAAPIKILVTSVDVLHSWTVPNLGLKVDAVPGRINQFVFEIKQPGTYYGQCSELCGSMHAFMPINLQVVTEEDFRTWLRKNGQVN